tara:strand:+ start:72 stop:506 length:435 start_codon:yes stop_codon:yes gene_type:complete
MKLEELKKMIKEEFDNFVTNEAEADDVSVDVDSDDLDAEKGGEGNDDVLRQIFMLLKTHFEGGEESPEAPEDVEGEDMDEEADLEEASAMGFGDAGNKNTSGKDVGFTPAKTTRGDGKLHESKEGKETISEEVKRFQKLANINK